MGTRYLKTAADVDFGSAWSRAGTGIKPTFWETLDGDSGTSPPTTDSGVSYALANNSSVPGTSPEKLIVRLESVGSSPLEDPVSHKHHVFQYVYRKAGTGTFTTWPYLDVLNDGVSVLDAPVLTIDPGTAFAQWSYTLSETEAARIDWTKSLDLVFTDPVKGSGTCAVRITTAWFELPSAWSLEAEGYGEALGEADGDFTNRSFAGYGQALGVAAGGIVSLVFAGYGQADGVASAILVERSFDGYGVADGTANGSMGDVVFFQGYGDALGVAVGFVTYAPSRALGWAPSGGVAAGIGG